MKRNFLAPVYLALAGSLLLGCGKDDREETEASAHAFDSAQSEAAVSASFHEVMDSMSDTNMASSENTAFALQGGLDVEISLERECQVLDDKAVVTIARDKAISWERSNLRIAVSASATIDHDITRTWSQEGAAVGCDANHKAAAIDFEGDLTGYQLDIAVKRSAERSLERTLKRTGETATHALQSSVDGTRQAKWLSQETLDDGSISRSRTVSFSVTRNDNFVARDGTVRELSLALETKEALQVSAIWDSLSRTRQLLSKRIASGVIKASHAGRGHVEASFDDLLMTFTESSCAVQSGSMEAKIFAEGSTEPARIYNLTAVDGEITVQDVTDPANPVDVEGFDYTPCDRQDFSY
ncbi:hypothetical protein [Oligoflexus tunisiensis]|uniref:hypothetical protein n=1 Tax=Oligoflexus tunisiensis TaxID=708132 RepID=UPI00114CE7E3|nr:hypothetical protein [Oligoflexus tunisiensis]